MFDGDETLFVGHQGKEEDNGHGGSDLQLDQLQNGNIVSTLLSVNFVSLSLDIIGDRNCHDKQ